MKIKFVFATILGLLSFRPVYAQGAGSDRLIQFYQWRVSRDPEDYTNYDHLGSAYSQKARETSDPTYYELSEKTYKQALALLSANQPERAGISAHLAALYLSEHRFEESLALANHALVLNQDLVSGYATLGDAQLETGKYQEAELSYARLRVPEGSLPPRPGLAYLSETRQASLCYIKGKAQEALSHMQASIALAMEAELPKENIAWSYFSLGELYYGMGNLAQAETSYQAALQTYPNYHRALAWLGQLRAAQARYVEAVDLYRQAVAMIPLPAYIGALGDLYSKIGQEDEAKKEYELVGLIAKLSALSQNLFRRELALFYADHAIHLAEALKFARQELEVRQDVYTWDVLAWAYYKNGQFQEAADAISHALGQGTKDAQLFFHAGMIFEKVGDHGKARDYLRQTIETNPHFHILYSEVARETLAQLEKNFHAGLAEESIAR